MIRSALVIVLCLAPVALSAQSLKGMRQASELGNILAAEDFCGFSYDQDAISTWIDENTDPSDMGFSGDLTMMTEGAKFTQAEMSGSTKTAHCRSVERTARHFGFIK